MYFSVLVSKGLDRVGLGTINYKTSQNTNLRLIKDMQGVRIDFSRRIPFKQIDPERRQGSVVSKVLNGKEDLFLKVSDVLGRGDCWSNGGRTLRMYLRIFSKLNKIVVR